MTSAQLLVGFNIIFSLSEDSQIGFDVFDSSGVQHLISQPKNTTSVIN